MNSLINNLTNISIYLIYTFIAVLSIVISYKVSVIICLMVIPIELLRLTAIYKKMHRFVVLVMLLNIVLVSYISYKLDLKTTAANIVQNEKNQIATTYLHKTWVTVSNLNKTLNNVQISKQTQIDYWAIIAMYLAFELAMLLFIKELNKQTQKEIKKPTKSIKQVNTKLTKEVKAPVIVTTLEKPVNEENLQYVGSYLDYSRANPDISVRKAKELFEQWKQEGRLQKRDGKNYLHIDIER